MAHGADGEARGKVQSEYPNELPVADSYGGVLISRSNKVLLVEPKGHFGGYVWTFAKGRPAEGESALDAAMRHIRGKGGYQSEILGILPERYGGTTSTSAYVLAGPRGQAHQADAHTAATRWVSFGEAKELIGLTAHAEGRARDLAVLLAAEELAGRLSALNQPATCKEDWDALPLPERHTRLELGWTFDPTMSRRIRKGFLPDVMEQKWFAWFDGVVLHLHRSWTGFCIYQITFEAHHDQLKAVSALANRDPRQHMQTDDREDGQALLNILNAHFAHDDGGSPENGFSEALALASQPNYLGSPEVVSEILAQIINSAVSYFQKEGSFDSIWDLAWVRASQIVEGEDYVQIPNWHTTEALGRQLVEQFAIHVPEPGVDTLDYYLKEAFIALALKVLEMLRDYSAEFSSAVGD